MECIDPGSSDKHWDYPEGWLLLSEPPQWAPLTMTASPSAMAQTEGQFHENGGSVNIEELLSEARDQVQVVLMDDLRCLNKAELRKYNKIPDVERTKLMMRDSLPANVSDEAIANVCHYMGNSLNTAAQQHVRNSHYRPCRKKTERKVTDNEKANESQQGNVSADSADHTPASASLVDQVDPADHARNHRLHTSQVSGVFGLHRCVAAYLLIDTRLYCLHSQTARYAWPERREDYK